MFLNLDKFKMFKGIYFCECLLRGVHAEIIALVQTDDITTFNSKQQRNLMCFGRNNSHLKVRMIYILFDTPDNQKIIFICNLKLKV